MRADRRKDVSGKDGALVAKIIQRSAKSAQQRTGQGCPPPAWSVDGLMCGHSDTTHPSYARLGRRYLAGSYSKRGVFWSRWLAFFLARGRRVFPTASMPLRLRGRRGLAHTHIAGHAGRGNIEQLRFLRFDSPHRQDGSGDAGAPRAKCRTTLGGRSVIVPGPCCSTGFVSFPQLLGGPKLESSGAAGCGT